MTQGRDVPEFTRQELRKATKFVEGDYTGINPRSFYRKLKRSIEEIQEDNDFKYQTAGSQDGDLNISSEEVGQKTGTVKGRMSASSDWRNIGAGELEYRPYGPQGAAGIILGIVLLLLGLSGAGTIWTALGILGSGAGVYGYWQQERETFPIIRQDVIRTLLTGEVSERTTESSNETRTDIFANMSVVFAGDSFVAVDVGALDELDWTFRRELGNQARRWYNQVADTEREQVTIEDGFVWQLKGLADRDIQSHRSTISSAQSGLIGDDSPFEYRQQYTDILEKQLPPETQEKLQSHEENLMLELEELAEDLDIYVEREGLEHTSNVEQRQNSDNPELETGGSS